MTAEPKLIMLINFLLWLPAIWLVWNQFYQIKTHKKRLKILDKCQAILEELNELNLNPAIDENHAVAAALREREAILWRQYRKLLA